MQLTQPDQTNIYRENAVFRKMVINGSGIFEPEKEDKARRVSGNHGRDHTIGRMGSACRAVLF